MKGPVGYTVYSYWMVAVSIFQRFPPPSPNFSDGLCQNSLTLHSTFVKESRQKSCRQTNDGPSLTFFCNHVTKCAYRTPNLEPLQGPILLYVCLAVVSRPLASGEERQNEKIEGRFSSEHFLSGFRMGRRRRYHSKETKSQRLPSTQQVECTAKMLNI